MDDLSRLVFKMGETIIITVQQPDKTVDLSAATLSATLVEWKSRTAVGAFTVNKITEIGGQVWDFTLTLPTLVASALVVGVDYSFDVKIIQGTSTTKTDSSIIEIILADTP